MERLLVAWQEAVFELYLAEEKIEPEVVENMRSWEHSGFRVDQSVFLPAGDQAGIERVVQYMTRCPSYPELINHFFVLQPDSQPTFNSTARAQVT